jgi:hypothetical protein
MTDKNKTCDVCGHGELYAGVASSALGPMSQAYCAICLGMGADTKIMVEATIEGCNGIENVGAWLCYYDKEKDSYIDTKTNKVAEIVLNNGMKFKTRGEYIQHLKDAGELDES